MAHVFPVTSQFFLATVKYPLPLIDLIHMNFHLESFYPWHMKHFKISLMKFNGKIQFKWGRFLPIHPVEVVKKEKKRFYSEPEY